MVPAMMATTAVGRGDEDKEVAALRGVRIGFTSSNHEVKGCLPRELFRILGSHDWATRSR